MKKVLAIILAAILVLSLVACSTAGAGTTAKEEPKQEEPKKEENALQEAVSEVAETKEDGPIVIGFLGWSSGADAMYGLVPQFLMEHYFKEVNANGGWLGRQIDFRAYDISGLDGDFSEAVNAANKLIQSGADIIMGPSNSTQGAAVAELCNAAGVLHIPSGSSQSVTVDDNGNVRPYTYRSGSVNRNGIAALATFAYKELGAPKVACLYETTQVDTVDMEDEFVTVYEKLGGTITDVATYTINDIEFRAQLTKLAEGNPDYIFMPVMGYKEAGFAALQLKELGYENIKLLGSYVFDTVDLIDQAGSALDGCYFATDGDLDDPRFDDIRASYEEYHASSGMAIHMPGLKAFNEVKIAEYAVNTAGSTDADAMKKALDEATYIDLITTSCKGFDPATHNINGIEFTIKTCENGAFKTVGKYSAE